MADANSLMYAEPIGTTSGSSSLAGRESALNPIRIYYNVKKVTSYGNALTWGYLRSYQKSWGIQKPIQYSVAMPGYTYFWDIEKGVFTVTDTAGGVTEHSGIRTIKDLGISWEILRSVQFRSFNLDDSNGDTFIICKRMDPKRIGQTNHIGEFMHNDYLSGNDQHTLFDRITDAHTLYDLFAMVTGYFADSADRAILLANTNHLQANNLYPLNMINSPINLHSERIRLKKQGIQCIAAHYVMIAIFAQHLLSTDNDIVYEPWMLWAAYQWYVNTVRVATNNRQIFDLSPRW